MWVNISLVVYPVLGDELGWSIQVFIQFLMDGKDGGRHSAGVVEWNMPMVFCLSVFWPSRSTMTKQPTARKHTSCIFMQHGFMQCATRNSLPKFKPGSLASWRFLPSTRGQWSQWLPSSPLSTKLGYFRHPRMPADAAEPKFPLMHSEKHAVPARRPSAWHTIPDSTWRRCYESLLKYCHVFFIFFGGGLSPWLLTQQRHDPWFISPDVVSIPICQIGGVIGAYRNQ